MLINRSHALVSGLSQIGQAYWSDELGEAQTYGDITVTLESIKKIIGLVIREFCVRDGSKVLFGVLLTLLRSSSVL